MFSKFLIFSLLLSPTAYAHAPHSKSHVHRNVHTNHHASCHKASNAGWVWYPGRWTYIKVGVRRHTIFRQQWSAGYWEHNIYGKSHRTHRAGPPTHHHR